MINLVKLPKPKILIDNEKTWTIEYRKAIRTGKKPLPTKYNQKEIKDILIAETCGKCAYCESKVTAVYPGDIEHILPKNKRPDLYVEWSNLTFSCHRCNSAEGKGSYYNLSNPLINPYIDNVDNHLLWVGPIVLQKTPKGLLTGNKLGLNRLGLVQSREEKLEEIAEWLKVWNLEGPAKTIAEDHLDKQYHNSKEYSAAVKKYLKQNKFPVR